VDAQRSRWKLARAHMEPMDRLQIGGVRVRVDRHGIYSWGDIQVDAEERAPGRLAGPERGDVATERANVDALDAFRRRNGEDDELARLDRSRGDGHLDRIGGGDRLRRHYGQRQSGAQSSRSHVAASSLCVHTVILRYPACRAKRTHSATNRAPIRRPRADGSTSKRSTYSTMSTICWRWIGRGASAARGPATRAPAARTASSNTRRTRPRTPSAARPARPTPRLSG